MKRVARYLIFFAILILVLPTGCGQPAGGGNEPDETEPTEDIGEWSITIEVVGVKSLEFTHEDALSIGPDEIRAAEKDKDVFGDVQVWQGILLTDLLEFVGVKEFSVISVISADGSTRELDPDRIGDSATGIGWKVNGERLDDERGPIQLIADQRGPKWWVTNVKKIEVIQ
jgi:DMSO/TMAO reductase YedYZ molybdopterin-dependent catalytic subunit